MALKHLLATAALAAAGLVFAATDSRAQGVCPMGQPAPQTTSVTSLALVSANQCSFFIFSSQTPVTVTLPAAVSLQNPAYAVLLMSTGAPVTIVSGGSSTLNGQSAQNGQSFPQQSIGGFQPTWVMGDGTNFWLISATPTPMVGQFASAQYSNSGTSTPYLMPGTTIDGSPVLKMGNGVLQLTNQSSWQDGAVPPKLASNICGGAPVGWGQRGSAWLAVYDWMGLRRYIPTC